MPEMTAPHSLSETPVASEQDRSAPVVPRRRRSLRRRPWSDPGPLASSNLHEVVERPSKLEPPSSLSCSPRPAKVARRSSSFSCGSVEPPLVPQQQVAGRSQTTEESAPVNLGDLPPDVVRALQQLATPKYLCPQTFLMAVVLEVWSKFSVSILTVMSSSSIFFFFLLSRCTTL